MMAPAMAVTTPAARVPARPRGGARLRADERALVVTAGGVFALASAGAAMSAAAADALFLAELGPAHLGEAVAASSALLAVVLAVVGGLGDRLERRRVLGGLAAVSAAALVGVAALSLVSPRLGAGLALIGGKQLAAATDLAFWIMIAERVDARRSQRLVPLLAAAGGVGATAGALLVVPLAAVLGARGVLVAAAVVLVLAMLGAARLPATRRVAAPPAAPARLIARAWRDGARAVRQHPLAAHLALVVGAAGVFGSLAYFALGVEVAARGGSTAALAALLGAVRGGGQLVTLVAQLVVAPRLLARLGTGPALLLAPAVALVSGLGLVAAPVLGVAIAMQASARVLDAAIETPAEKLAQTLLPGRVRGRIAGFLDGTAKRLGAVIGGLLAAALAGAPGAFHAACALAAAVWLLAAARIARALPSLAVAHVTALGEAEREAPEPAAIVDERTVALLATELAGPRPARAAEVLVRLHEAGRIDAVGPLVHAALRHGGMPVWRALVELLHAPAPLHAAQLVAAARACAPAERELALRATGLAGGPAALALVHAHGDAEPALVLTAAIAALRLAGDDAEVLAVLGEAVREAGPRGRVALEELCVELRRALAARADEGALAAARHLVRALRRRRGDEGSRATALGGLARVIAWGRDRRDAELSLLRADVLELVRERVEAGASPVAPADALTSLVRAPRGAAVVDDAPEIAAALRLYGAVLEGADRVEPEDLRRIARALGEPDDDVRAAAEAALTGLGAAAAGELIATAAWGRRRARDRAAALLAELPVTPAALDRLIDAELDGLDQTHAAITALVHPGDELLARRLDERLREIAQTVLLLVAARRRSRPIADAAHAWRHARGAHERARTLAVVEAALPRALVGRLVDAVDVLTPAERAERRTAAGLASPAREDVIRAELAGRDRLARGLVLHALGAAGRSAHRDTITHAARAEALATSPTDLLRRLTSAVVDEGAPDMPTRVETLIALGRVPLLAALSTRQLADVAERARWSTARAGDLVATAGEPLDALLVVEDGELALGDRVIAAGEAVDELACVAPVPLAGDLRALRATRLVRLERVDFEELVDDVPGLAAAVCRALGERARRAEDHAYRSPLVSRSA